MSNGTLAVWSGIDADTEDDYNAWYEREHMFERIEVPGIRRALPPLRGVDPACAGIRERTWNQF